ncbi:MAG TPA: OmpH family outer membrane protein [Candidatus Acidoferrales bacterium]|nr:OmpH family outer membrane protein [Candidatus Acidoferrales bacterium]
MKIRNAGMAALAALLIVPAAWAQAESTAPAAATGKIAVINLQAAIAGTAEGKQASKELQAQFASRQTELENLRKQISDLQQRLQAGQTTLSDEEKARLASQGNILTRKFQREQQDLQDDGNDAQQLAINRIGQKMMTVLDKFAKQNGVNLILDDGTSAQSAPVVLYSANQVDVTQQIIKLYDTAYPVKPSAPAASRPGASKPSQK